MSESHSQGIEFPWDNKVYEVSGEVVDHIKGRTGKTGKFTVRVAHAVANKFKQHPQRVQRLQELFVYAIFEGDLKVSELTWLTCQIGGNNVRPLVQASVKYHQQKRAA